MPLLETQNLTKTYPGVTALDQVSLELHPGQIHGLIGENGAGKSTLIKILAGVISSDSGEVLVDGRQVHLRTPQDAQREGIAVVHQHTHLIPDLSVAENYALRLSYARSKIGMIDWREMNRQARDAVGRLLPGLNVRRPARTLSGVEQKLVELSFALSASPRVLILDEPTAVLPENETKLLFDQIRSFVANGTSVLFITHRLEEVFEITNHVTVLRDGKTVSQRPTQETSHDDLIHVMVGRSVSFERDDSHVPEEQTALTLRSFTDDVHETFKDIHLQVHRGEIYGIYGLVGAGQSELCQALFDLHPASGEVIRDVDSKNTAGFNRLAYVPADRHIQGVFHQMSVGENLSIASLESLTSTGLIDFSKENQQIDKQIQELQIKTLHRDQDITQLSGGNQQKVLLGRWMMTHPAILILEEPTQGVDVGAKGQIHQIIRQLASQGVSIILVSSEIPELLALSHRVGVMREGRLAGELEAKTAGEEDLLRLALAQSESRPREGSADDRPHSAPRNTINFFAAQREAGLAFLMACLFLIFALTVQGFFTVENLIDLLKSNSILLVGALGMTAVIIAGGIDISIGAILGLAAVLAGKLAESGEPAWLVLGLALLAGTLLGFINGALSVVGRIHSIVITLGTLSIFRAAIFLVTDRKQLVNLPETVTWIRKASIGGWVPMLLLVSLLAVLGLHLFLRYSVTGRRLFVLGGDRASAVFLGIYPRAVLPIAFALCGLLAGLAGLMWAGLYGNVQTNVGQNFELQVIAAVVIGGTHIMGGRGSALGTLLGAIFLGTLNNVLVLAHVSPYWEGVFLGAMILLALGVDVVLWRLEGQRQ